MQLLIDTDAFCKVGLAGLLDHTATLFGTTLPQCRRLDALPHMLRRGKLRRHYGPDCADSLIAIAKAIPAAPTPNDRWLNLFAEVDQIDVGEARLLALAAATRSLIVTGDKRALRPIGKLPPAREALARRIVTIEALLLALAEHIGPTELAARVTPVARIDTMFQACFSPSTTDPRPALISYYNDTVNELRPLILWCPNHRNGGPFRR